MASINADTQSTIQHTRDQLTITKESKIVDSLNNLIHLINYRLTNHEITPEEKAKLEGDLVNYTKDMKDATSKLDTINTAINACDDLMKKLPHSWIRTSSFIDESGYRIGFNTGELEWDFYRPATTTSDHTTNEMGMTTMVTPTSSITFFDRIPDMVIAEILTYLPITISICFSKSWNLSTIHIHADGGLLNRTVSKRFTRCIDKVRINEPTKEVKRSDKYDNDALCSSLSVAVEIIEMSMPQYAMLPPTPYSIKCRASSAQTYGRYFLWCCSLLHDKLVGLRFRISKLIPVGHFACTNLGDVIYNNACCDIVSSPSRAPRTCINQTLTALDLSLDDSSDPAATDLLEDLLTEASVGVTSEYDRIVTRYSRYSPTLEEVTRTRTSFRLHKTPNLTLIKTQPTLQSPAYLRCSPRLSITLTVVGHETPFGKGSDIEHPPCDNTKSKDCKFREMKSIAPLPSPLECTIIKECYRCRAFGHLVCMKAIPGLSDRTSRNIDTIVSYFHIRCFPDDPPG